MGKRIDLHIAAHEAEAEAMTELLRDHGIDADAIPRASSPYPNIAYPGWGVVRVPEEDQAKAAALIQQFSGHDSDEDTPVPGRLPEARIENAPHLTSRQRVWRVFRGAKTPLVTTLILGSLALNGVLLAQKWAPPPLVYEQTDALGRVTLRVSYRQGAAFPYETISFGPRGDVQAVFRDGDENGWFERVETRHNGDTTWEHVDENENGVYEVSQGLFAGKPELIVTDIDENTRPESVRRIADGAMLKDADGDGFFDICSCVDKSGANKSFDLRACP